MRAAGGGTTDSDQTLECPPPGRPYPRRALAVKAIVIAALALAGCGGGGGGDEGTDYSGVSPPGGTPRSGVCDTAGDCRKQRPDGSWCYWANEQVGNGVTLQEAEFRACGYLGSPRD